MLPIQELYHSSAIELCVVDGQPHNVARPQYVRCTYVLWSQLQYIDSHLAIIIHQSQMNFESTKSREQQLEDELRRKEQSDIFHVASRVPRTVEKLFIDF